MSTASIHDARHFLAEGEGVDRFDWLDADGRSVAAFPAGGMVRLRKRTASGFVSVRIAVEDILELQDVLPREVWEC